MTLAMTLPSFDFEAPADLDEVCALLARSGPSAKLLAGGTDLLVKMKRGDIEPRLLVSLSRLPAQMPSLAQVEPLAGGDVDALRVGALCTMASLAVSPELAGWGRALAEGAASVGGPVIRNRATVGGNVLNARPCADTLPPLMALGARLQLRSQRGEREVDVDGFISGPGATALQPDELLTHIVLPTPGTDRCGSCYLKITRRASMEVTTAGCAASVVLDAAGNQIERARVVLASVAPVPLRITTAEAVLQGRQVSGEAVEEAAIAARDAAQPIDDHRAPALYRREVVQVIARRALGEALARAQGRSP